MSMPAQAPEAVEVFYSYSHEDEAYRRKLEKHLALLQRQGVISAWHDRHIEDGADWDATVRRHLESAKLILLLVSPDFLHSDYCYDVEMKRALERHQAGEARVIPIALRPVDSHDAPFMQLQGLPTGFRPVTAWDNQDLAFADIARGIRRAAQHFRVRPACPPSRPHRKAPRRWGQARQSRCCSPIPIPAGNRSARRISSGGTAN